MKKKTQPQDAFKVLPDSFDGLNINDVSYFRLFSMCSKQLNKVDMLLFVADRMVEKYFGDKEAGYIHSKKYWSRYLNRMLMGAFEKHLSTNIDWDFRKMPLCVINKISMWSEGPLDFYTMVIKEFNLKDERSRTLTVDKHNVQSIVQVWEDMSNGDNK